MLLPLSYNHLASWIYYSFVFIFRLLFINSWSQTFCLLKGFYLMYSSISFTYTSFVVAAFLSVFQKPTFSGWAFFSQNFPWRTSQRLTWLTFHQSRLHHFTRDRISYFPGTCFAGTATSPSSSNLPLFQGQIFACSWTQNTERHIIALHLNHVVWPVWFGSWDSPTSPSADYVATLFWSLGLTVPMHRQLLREHSSFPVTYILLDKDAARWKDCRVLTFYSNSSHFNTWLKKETTSSISEAAAFCLQSCCELFIPSSAWHFALPPSLVPSTLIR